MAALNKTSGTFYGVGIGPGDPELLTLKALRIIRQCDLITYLRSERGHSMARDIASAAVSAATHPDQKEYAIIMPMCETREVANAVYDEAARVIADHLDQAQDVGFLCQGDPFFFGSFAYLHDRLNDRYPIGIVPGVTSINASSALSGKPLGLLAENLAVISGRRSDEDILHTLSHFDNVAIMKPGRRRSELLQLIAQAGRTQDACYLEYAGQEKQKIIYDISLLDAQPGPYFSLFLINRSRDYTPSSKKS
ncbi:precorrin-2 C(20)-methyltransferase [Candidatus Spongiihabitans sp.]|uniref:precorrin-2 C(20)-methyltransferase n=1 Tax=Candidatus Spongiihabitans sp. TaxID=3101308 RepID=UPI003C6F8F4A